MADQVSNQGGGLKKQLNQQEYEQSSNTGPSRRLRDWKALKLSKGW